MSKYVWQIKLFGSVEEYRNGITDAIGCFETEEEAIAVLTDNISDLWENVYHYAKIEKLEVGRIYPLYLEHTFWRYNQKKNGYEKIGAPWCNLAVDCRNKKKALTIKEYFDYHHLKLPECQIEEQFESPEDFLKRMREPGKSWGDDCIEAAKKKCYMCGEPLSPFDLLEGYYLDKRIGYGSIHDGDQIKFRLCCECFDKIIDQIRPLCDHDILIDMD